MDGMEKSGFFLRTSVFFSELPFPGNLPRVSAVFKGPDPVAQLGGALEFEIVGGFEHLPFEEALAKMQARFAESSRSKIMNAPETRRQVDFIRQFAETYTSYIHLP